MTSKQKEKLLRLVGDYAGAAAGCAILQNDLENDDNKQLLAMVRRAEKGEAVRLQRIRDYITTLVLVLLVASAGACYQPTAPCQVDSARAVGAIIKGYTNNQLTQADTLWVWKRFCANGVPYQK